MPKIFFISSLSVRKIQQYTILYSNIYNPQIVFVFLVLRNNHLQYDKVDRHNSIIRESLFSIFFYAQDYCIYYKDDCIDLRRTEVYSTIGITTFYESLQKYFYCTRLVA